MPGGLVLHRYLVTEYTLTGPNRPEASKGDFARYGFTSANV